MVAGHGQDTHSALTGQSRLQQETSKLCTLLKRFANGQCMDVVYNAANVLIKDVRHDEGLMEWFKSVDVYVHKVCFPSFSVLYVEVHSLMPSLSASLTQVTSLSQTATTMAASCVRAGPSSTMASTITLTICSTQWAPSR